jgi:thioredoxin-dependent peroxiredoxin
MLKAGEKAPEFVAETDMGKKVKLSDFAGKKVILWFYPKADTPGCTVEGCGFRDRASQLEERNTVVLGVSFDSVDDNRKFADKFSFPFPLLCDTERSIGLAYGACQSREDTYAARIGYIIDEHGKIQNAYPKVDAKSFPETVLGDL